MKKLALCLLLIMTTIYINGQDTRNFFSDATIGYIPILTIGSSNVGTESRPVYEHTETKGTMLNFLLHVGVKQPFLIKDSWSAGVRLSVGWGGQGNMSNAEGLTSYVFDFPEYIYYRNNSSNIDFSVLLGYKYTKAALNSHLLLFGLEYHIDDDRSLRFYGSFYRYKYYTQYTNGRVEPAIKIGEFGLVYTYNF